MRYFTKIIYSLIFLLLPTVAYATEELEFRSFLDKQLVCLAEAIYFESRGEPFIGQPVKHKCEFSYWCDGKIEEIDDPIAYHESISAASLLSEGVELLSVKKALHYHAIYVRPFWSETYKKLTQIGKHIFYSRERSN